MSRLTVAGLMGMVVAFAAGFVALRHPTDSTASVVYVLSHVVLLVGLLGALVRPAPAGAWRGFAVFGYGYFSLFFGSFNHPMYQGQQRVSPLDPIVGAMIARLHPELMAPEKPNLSRPGEPVQVNDIYSWHSLTSPSGYVALSKEDTQSWEQYIAFQEAYLLRIQADGTKPFNIHKIAHSELMMGCAFAGAFTGRLLAARWTRPPGAMAALDATSSDPNPPARRAIDP